MLLANIQTNWTKGNVDLKTSIKKSRILLEKLFCFNCIQMSKGPEKIRNSKLSGQPCVVDLT